MRSAGSAPIEILLVEDNPDDADHMREALEEGDLKTNITVVEDGEEAIQYLRRHGRFAAVLRPDLILLDLHLPRKSGQEVLGEIKQDESLRRIPVIVLTSLADERVFQDAYDLHANCCVRKPANLEQFALTVKKIEHFWLRVASTIRGQ
jgi:chemotaxis family two-component system response regulator Rcp1